MCKDDQLQKYIHRSCYVCGGICPQRCGIAIIIKEECAGNDQGSNVIDDNSLQGPGPRSRSFIPSSVQLVCKDLKDQDKDAEHGNIE
jgi:hypothetical protein